MQGEALSFPLNNSSVTMAGVEKSIEDDPTWTTGEVTIISSDGVRFKISSHVLAGAR